MQLVWVMSAAAFKQAGFGVGLVVGPAGSHSISLVKFVEEDVAAFELFDIIIYPDFVIRHKFIYVVVSAGGKVDIEDTANEAAVDNPDTDTVFEFFPESLVNLPAVGQLPASVSQPVQVTCPAAFTTFDAVGFDESLVVGDTLCHKMIFCQEMVYKKPQLVVFGFTVNPELIFRDVAIPVMLAKIGKLLIDMAANEAAVDNPYLQVVDLLDLFNVRRFWRLIHIGAFRFFHKPKIAI